MLEIASDYRPAEDALQGRIVLVTGAGSGIGRAVSQALAARHATVVLLGRRAEPLEATYDAIVNARHAEPAILPLNLATATPENYAELADRIQDELGGLDGLVHNAAHLEGLTPFRDVSAESWYRTLQVNLSGPYLLTQALLPLLQNSRCGRIVFTLEDPDRTERAYWGAYGVSKAAARTMTRILADELANTRVGVYGVQPGPTRTALRAKAWAAEDPESQPEPSQRTAPYVALLDPAFRAEPGAIYRA